jgi:hypothetical protein
MTALDSWALAGVLCRHVSCRGWNAAGFQPPSVGALQKGQWTLLDLRIGLGIVPPQERKRFKPRN